MLDITIDEHIPAPTDGRMRTGIAPAVRRLVVGESFAVPIGHRAAVTAAAQREQLAQRKMFVTRRESAGNGQDNLRIWRTK